MEIETFFDQDTFTLTYIVYDPNSQDAIIIDPVLDYDPHASKISYTSLNNLNEFISKNHLNIHYILETHAHADHLSSSVALKALYPNAKIAISQNITEVQKVFKNVFHFEELKIDGSQFDQLLKDKDKLTAGTIQIEVIATPGHTPACLTFKIEDNLFTGDALFMPDYGTGRCDFPAGSAKDLYHSIHHKLYQLADETKVFVGHDYQPDGRELKWQTTIGESKKMNKQLRFETSEAEFVSMRNQRDATLKAPRLLLQSVQVNINAGIMPKAESNGVSYLKMPIKAN